MSLSMLRLTFEVRLVFADGRGASLNQSTTRARLDLKFEDVANTLMISLSYFAHDSKIAYNCLLSSVLSLELKLTAAHLKC